MRGFLINHLWSFTEKDMRSVISIVILFKLEKTRIIYKLPDK